MRCKCSSCQATLAIDNDQLSKRRVPAFKCPKCNALIQIKPRIANCGSCKEPFSFYPHKFKGLAALMNCPNCKTTNRVNLRHV